MSDQDALYSRARELGEARIRLAESITSPEQWKEMWTEPERPFPFVLTNWKQCLCYSVADYAAEAGFFIDLLGLPAPLFGPDNALLTSPDRDFHFQIAGLDEGEEATPPETISLMFHVENIREACAELQARGVVFSEPLAPMGGPGSAFRTAEFMTPHGVPVKLWGMVDVETD